MANPLRTNDTARTRSTWSRRSTACTSGFSANATMRATVNAVSVRGISCRSACAATRQRNTAKTATSDRQSMSTVRTLTGGSTTAREASGTSDTPVLYGPMAAQQPIEPQPAQRLRISLRSAVVLVAMLGATLALIRLVSVSQRVLGWILVAGAIAGLLHPLVAPRRAPGCQRGVAVLAVVILMAAVGGLVAYRRGGKHRAGDAHPAARPAAASGRARTFVALRRGGAGVPPGRPDARLRARGSQSAPRRHRHRRAPGGRYPRRRLPRHRCAVDLLPAARPAPGGGRRQPGRR